jgi:exosortase/archaeosortase family protein
VSTEPTVRPSDRAAKRPPSDRPTAPLPAPFLVALGIIGAFAALVIWDQSTWWGSKDEYMFGYLVPLFVAYVVFDRWARIRGLLSTAANRSDGETVGRSDGGTVRQSDGSTELPVTPHESPIPNHDSPLTSHATGTVAPWLTLTARALAGLGLVGGLAAFTLGAFYRSSTGSSQPGSLAMAMGFGALTLALLYLALPAGGSLREEDGGQRTDDGGRRAVGRSDGETVRPFDGPTEAPAADGPPGGRKTADGGRRAPNVGLAPATESPLSNHQSPTPSTVLPSTIPPSDRAAERPPSDRFAALIAEPRWQVTALFLFPALVWMVSAPLVSAVENSLSTFLLNKVTVIVFFTFDVLGYPLERQGSVLVLPLGTVGVAEACSGIRSLTGSIFSGFFLAAAFLPGIPRKLGLVAAAIVLAFLMNIVRSLVLTAVAYAKGPEAIEGSIHDITGFAVLGATFLGLLALLPLFGRAGARADDGGRTTEDGRQTTEDG